MQDVLLANSSLSFEAIEFDKIESADYLPALEKAIELAKSKIEKIKQQSPSFTTTIEAFEVAQDEVDRVSHIFYHVFHAHATQELSEIAPKFIALLTSYSNDISLDHDLFNCVKKVWDNKDQEDLSSEQLKVLEELYHDFTRNGALLGAEDKEKLRKIDLKLSELTNQYRENQLNATNDYLMLLENEADLAGLPKRVKEQAKQVALEHGHDDKWAVNLQIPSYLPFMQYAEKRELRAKLYQARATLASSGEWNNRPLVAEIVGLRHQRSQLLGYKNHAEYILEKRMAKSKTGVLKLLEGLKAKSLPAAQRDYAELVKLKTELTNDSDFRKYDVAFYERILKMRKLNFDDEKLRPFFSLEKVLKGMFDVASKLYGLNFTQQNELPVYQKDVVVYEVSDEQQGHIGLFYVDLFPRKEKQSGAWMSEIRTQGLQYGDVKRPHIGIVCNFTKPSENTPSLLSLDEVLTLFHEFGHALHGLLSNVRYRSVAGTNVVWDFVELPSQIMENWVREKECLDLFASHYQTQEKIPSDLVDKIRQSIQFQEGKATARQLSLAYLDLAWYGDYLATEDIDVDKIEGDSLSEFDFLPKEEGENMSCQFGHIFPGGYSAGYYSYKWAEVLDADAFAYFKEQGIFNKEVASKFRQLLESGGSVDADLLYQNFRGRSPSEKALIQRAGL